MPVLLLDQIVVSRALHRVRSPAVPTVLDLEQPQLLACVADFCQRGDSLPLPHTKIYCTHLLLTEIASSADTVRHAAVHVPLPR